MKVSNRILLVFPMPAYFHLMESNLREVLNPVPPIGLLYVAAALEQRGYEVKVWDQALGTHKEFEELMDQFSPSMVGFGCCTVGYDNALALARKIKQVEPQLPIVFGGPHVTARLKETLRQSAVDYVVAGEGELGMSALADYLLRGQGKPESLQSVGYKLGDLLLINDRAPLIADLDSLPFPARHLVDLKRYEVPGVILSARGCPCQCNFCAAGPLSFRRNRPRGTANFVAEVVELYEKYGVAEFFIADDLFTANKRRAMEVCDALCKLPFRVSWSCESRVDTIDADLLDAMVKAGCHTVQYGVESGSDRVLREIHKFTTRSKIERAVKLAVAAGVRAACSIIIGHSADTEQTIRETIEFAAYLRSLSDYPNQVRTDFSVATPLPGSDLFEQADQLGLRIHHTSWSQYNFMTPLMDTPALTADEIRNLYFEACLSKTKDEIPAKEVSHG